jgi:cytochrome oxidase assembly protein ShyY1
MSVAPARTVRATACPGPRRGPSLSGVYRFALRPRWLLSHVLVAILIVTMIGLGLWQLRRLDDRRDRNALIEQRTEEPAAPLAEVLEIDDRESAEGVRFRRVELSGTYEVGSDVLVRNRTFDGQPGSWLLATLRLDDGGAVVVSRGWVPVTGEQAPPDEALAPDGPVTVDGIIETTQERGRFGSTDPAEGTLRRVARVDVERLADQIDGQAYPVWVQATTERPDPGELPVPVEPPELDDGPHFGYAMQWFTFCLIALIGYPLVLRRVARQVDVPPVDDAPPAWGDEPGVAS